MSLCPHGYTAFYDCPHCECPGCRRAQGSCVCHLEPALASPGPTRQMYTPAQLARVQRFLAAGDDVTAAERVRPGAAPALGWLVFGIAMTFLAAWALPDLVAWVHSWRTQ